MARPTRGGSSRRTTGSGARTGARRTTSTGRSTTRATTTRGRAAKKGNPTVLVGGAIVGGVAVLALVAVVAKGGGKKSGDEEESSGSGKVSLSDLAPKDTAPKKTYKPATSRKPIAKRDAPVKPKHPASYYLAMCDQALWTQAKDHAKDAQKLLADVRKGTVDNPKAAKQKIREGFGMALELANEFLSPVESKYRAEAGHFLKQYDDIMMSWQRNMRSVVYGRDK